MLLARDFREIARDALRGRWGLAVITGLVASLLGASISVNNGNGVGTVGGGSNADAVTDVSYANIQTSVNQIIHSDWFQSILPFLMGLIIVMVAWTLISLVLGGAVTLGYAQFNLNLVDENDPQFGDLFSHIRRLWEGFCMQFFQGMMVFLWSLLFVIPGIIASYRYSMTPYILAENMELSVMEAIAESKKMMRGNKFRLFCLELSFIGWDILAVLTLNIGDLWVHPYREAARAAFYREISEARYSNPYEVQEEPEPYSWNYDRQEEPEQPSGQEQPETSHYEEEKKEEHPFQDTDIWDEE